MTSDLLLARDCIIYWVTVWLSLVECMFDMIESELVRRGVALEGVEPPSRPAASASWNFDMLNFIEVFDIMHVEPATGATVWTALTGTRTALERDGHLIDPKAMAYCPADWIDERGSLDAELARWHPRPWGI